MQSEVTSGIKPIDRQNLSSLKFNYFNHKRELHMKIALIGAELEENLGLRYMASALEAAGHDALIVPFNEEADIARVVRTVQAEKPDIAGLSMVFTGRAREFCHLAEALRAGGFAGHLTAGGHFAALDRKSVV